MIKNAIFWPDQTKGEKETTTMEGKLSPKKKNRERERGWKEMILWNVQFWLKWWPNLYLCMPYSPLYSRWNPLFWTNCYNKKVLVGSINLLIWGNKFWKMELMDEIFLPIVRPPSLKANQFPIWHPKNYTFIFLNVTFVLVQLFLTPHFHNA